MRNIEYSVGLEAISACRPYDISWIVDPNIHPILTDRAYRHNACPYMRHVDRVEIFLIYKKGAHVKL